MNRESCIQTVELFRQLALNIHGVIDVIDDRNCNDIINLLKEQENEEERILKIVWDVLHGCVSTDTKKDQDYVYGLILDKVHPMH